MLASAKFACLLSYFLLVQHSFAVPVRTDLSIRTDDTSSNFVGCTPSKEEYFFRFEDASVVDAGDNILPLAARPGGKDYDDQAYKWISTDASKVTRSKMKGRVPTIYVVPKGTRAAIKADTKDFEVEFAAKRAVEYVEKDNEPGDVGINGIANTALADFRALVIRTVIKKDKSSSPYVTITKGVKTKTACKTDQDVLAPFSTFAGTQVFGIQIPEIITDVLSAWID